ncbi:DsbC family protein [Candidatus Thiodictyon syntrophicum]|jgi:thiol:disulfide interchange protein DsbC|uniref:Thiol:disulfide interchange protein n=1 Tax=Candidatus Thiodictyon syntrophicum TaxID=1166950 RepID=A0A2K8U8W3_9GAMM|nr:DsbC family protein [Candidatus Thiodictyon syntrophicum]AUB82026.1 disulfide bond formation protein DsbC [Candidatus Thiodictyon syntrophicum]
MHSPRLIVAAVLWLAAGSLLAAPEDNIRAALTKVIPGIKITSIAPSPVKGLFEVLVGTQMMYVTADGRYFVDGRIVDLTSREDLTEPRLSGARKQLVDGLGESQMVIFEPAGEAKHTVTVFTDIECGYCRKLHGQIAEYGKEGIRVRYLFFPRAGKGSPAYQEAVSVWCAGDAAARRAALTDAKAGKSVEEKTCDNPVDAHMAAGEELGLRGTPAILTDTGELIPGYVEPKRLAAQLAAGPASGAGTASGNVR